MGLLDRDHQRPRLLRFITRGLLFHLDVPLVYPPRQEVRDEDVRGEIASVASEFEHYVHPPVQVPDDLADRVLGGLLVYEVQSL